MNYDEYFLKCRRNFPSSSNYVEDFYNNPVRIFPSDLFSKKSLDALSDLAKIIKIQFDSGIYEQEIMCQHDDIWQFKNQLIQVSNDLVPYLENEFYGCHLYVDKIYIYRTKKLPLREASYLWHFDNNPNEIVKNLIYLNDVSDLNSPFEYFVDSLGRGVLGKCTRRGTKFWKGAENNSRVDQYVKSRIQEGTHSSVKVIAPFAQGCSFNNNAIHRANPVINGYRDVLNIRVKPSFVKPLNYIDPSWTTSFESTGVVDKNPEYSLNQK